MGNCVTDWVFRRQRFCCCLPARLGAGLLALLTLLVSGLLAVILWFEVDSMCLIFPSFFEVTDVALMRLSQLLHVHQGEGGIHLGGSSGDSVVRCVYAWVSVRLSSHDGRCSSANELTTRLTRGSAGQWANLELRNGWHTSFCEEVT